MKTENGKLAQIQIRAAKFAKETAKLKRASAVQKKWNIEREFLTKKDGTNSESVKLETLAPYISRYRAEIKKIGAANAETVLSIANLDSTEIDTLQAGNKKAAGTKLGNVRTVQNIDRIVETAKRYLYSADWAEIAAALAIITGRRSIEILKTGVFTVAKKRDAAGNFVKFIPGKTVFFSGQAKKKDGSAAGYVFNTLIDAAEICEAVARLRKLKNLDSENDFNKINRLTGRYTNEAAKKLFTFSIASNDNKNITMHDLRRISGRINADWYRGTSNESVYLSEFFGHETGAGLSSEATLKYFYFELEK